MAYGQKNYNELQGIAPQRYRINQIGCFLVAFSNLTGVDPLTLNRAFRDRGIYIDIDDGVRDDLAWNSITKFDSNWQIVRSGVGKPDSNNAIVKFITKTNNFGTHFSKVHDHTQGLIVDSWDGQVRHWSYYGNPVSYVIYKHNSPAPAPTPAPAPVSQPASKPTGEILVLPAVPAWAVYRLGTPGRKGTSDQVGTLAPAKFGGLVYDVLAKPMANFVTINTKDFGMVNIYVGPGTNAVIKQKQVTTPAPAPQPTPKPQPQPDYVTITVQNGWGISHVLKAAGYPEAGYSNSAQWLKVATYNGQPNGMKIKAGDKIKVPKYVPIAQPAPAPAPKPAPAPVTPPPIKNETPKPVVTEIKPAPAQPYVGPLESADDMSDEELDNVFNEINDFVKSSAKPSNFRQNIVALIATVQGVLIRIFTHNNKQRSK